eukprot:UN26156
MLNKQIKDREAQFKKEMEKIRKNEEKKKNKDIEKYKKNHKQNVKLAQQKTDYLKNVRSELKKINDVYKGLCKNLESSIDPGELIDRKRKPLNAYLMSLKIVGPGLSN